MRHVAARFGYFLVFCWMPLCHWDCHKMMWLPALWCDIPPSCISIGWCDWSPVLVVLDWAVTLLNRDFTELVLDWNCCSFDVLLDWTFFWTELLLYWTTIWLSCYLTELLSTWLNCCSTELVFELVFDWTVAVSSYYLMTDLLLVLGWTVTLLN